MWQTFVFTNKILSSFLALNTLYFVDYSVDDGDDAKRVIDQNEVAFDLFLLRTSVYIKRHSLLICA